MVSKVIVMLELEQLIKDMKKSLVDEVESEGFNVKHPQVTLAIKLNKLFPMSHGQMDKIHQIWSRSIRDLVWLGWLSEAKRRNSRYDDRICDALSASIIQAFEIGRRYSEERT